MELVYDHEHEVWLFLHSYECIWEFCFRLNAWFDQDTNCGSEITGQTIPFERTMDDCMTE